MWLRVWRAGFHGERIIAHRTGQEAPPAEGEIAVSWGFGVRCGGGLLVELGFRLLWGL